jgi:hypothetical protein
MISLPPVWHLVLFGAAVGLLPMLVFAHWLIKSTTSKTSAAPLFHDIASYLSQRYQILPSPTSAPDLPTPAPLRKYRPKPPGEPRLGSRRAGSRLPPLTWRLSACGPVTRASSSSVVERAG